MIYLDSETVGLTGPIVLFQYAVNDGEIVLYNPWLKTVNETIELFEWIATDEICGFNLSFDVFHICQMYTTCLLLKEWGYGESYLEDIINEYAIAERDARDGPCWKPKSALDLMLHARKGPFQTLMNREDIRIRKVPTALAFNLANHLNNTISLEAIYFSRKKVKSDQWQVFDREDPDFKDVVMKFAPSTALKVLAKHALKIKEEDILLFSDIEVDRQYLPRELKYGPYALANTKYNSYSTKELKDKFLNNKENKEDINWNWSWPRVINHHVAHWEVHDLARKYAIGDVDKTRQLRYYFNDAVPGDDDSILACMVGAIRWHGYAVNIDGIKQLKEDAQQRIKDIPTAPAQVRKWIGSSLEHVELVASEMEKKGSTAKVVLEKMSELKSFCCKNKACDQCGGEGKIVHPASKKARAVLDAREAIKEIELYDKLIIADRLHADFNVIGTLTSRMSGAGGLNVQGIKKAKKVREQFPLAFPGFVLNGGDFSAFEVVLAIAIWNSKKLEETVTSFRDCHICKGSGQSHKCNHCQGKGIINNKDDETLPCFFCNNGETKNLNKCFNCKGKGKVKTKIHALFGTFMYPDKTYEEILESDGSNIFDYYTRAKSGLFSQLYGGTAYTLATSLGIDTENAEKGFNQFLKEYPDIAEANRKVIQSFQSMKQQGKHGRIEWHEPADYVEEPILGHRRYFTLENKICKALYNLAQDPPKEWLSLKIKIVRTDREQTVAGAVQSALFGAAFQIQAANTRAALNHKIQSAGGKITKYVQRKIWDLQPAGIHSFKVLPMNVHDELMCPTIPELTNTIEDVIQKSIDHFKDRVPLLAMEWNSNIKNWAEKKGQ